MLIEVRLPFRRHGCGGREYQAIPSAFGSRSAVVLSRSANPCKSEKFLKSKKPPSRRRALSRTVERPSAGACHGLKSGRPKAGHAARASSCSRHAGPGLPGTRPARRWPRKTGDYSAGRAAAGPRNPAEAPLGQLERIAKVAARERRIAKLDKGDPPQRHVGPEVLMTGRKCIPQRVASRLRVAGLPELDPLFIILSVSSTFRG